MKLNNNGFIFCFVCFFREEAMVMANLRKRVAAIDLTRNGRRQDDLNANDTGQGQIQEQLDNRPLLPKVC